MPGVAERTDDTARNSVPLQLRYIFHVRKNVSAKWESANIEKSATTL